MRLALLLTLAAVAARADAPVATAVRLPEGLSIHVDGRLDEEAWSSAPPVADLRQREPAEGQPASERTEVRFLYDRDTLYVGARMWVADPSTIHAHVSRRDDVAQADFIGFDLDTFHDHRTGYGFGVTAGGVRLDGVYTQDEQWAYDNTLDLVWQAEVSRDDHGWSAEFRIPLTQLRFPRDLGTWGMNIERSIPARHEDDWWVVIGKQESGWLSHYGTLTGLDGLRGGRRRELLPFVAVDSLLATDRDRANPFDRGGRPQVRAGGDFKLATGNALMLEGTVQPDFGQVEADPAEVNLSAFETFFTEKRPFFVEGAELLQPVLGQPLFYSRRIGGVPRGPADGAYVDYPRATTILGAAKLTGRLANGTNLGVLAALTGSEAARVADVGGASHEVNVARPAGYLVAHALHPFGAHQSTVNGTATFVRRGVGGGDPLGTLQTRDALALGGESDIRFAGGDWHQYTTVSLSHVDGDPAAILRLQRASARYYQRPEAPVPLDPTRTSLSGWAGEIGVERTGGKHWLGWLSLNGVSPGFEINDLGQLSQADRRQLWTSLRFRETRPGPVFRAYSVQVLHSTLWSWDGDRQSSSTSLSLSSTWRNFWTASLSANVVPGGQDFRAARGGPSLGTRSHWSASASLGGPGSSPWRWSLSANATGAADGGRSRRLSASLQARPSPRFRIGLDPYLEWRRDARQYLSTEDGGPAETQGRRYVFGVVDRKTLSAQLRLTAAFTPDLALDLYAEPFAASGAYARFGEMVAPRSADLRFYGEDGSMLTRADGEVTVSDSRGSFTLAEPDFGVRSFRANVVLRWEYRPGSTLYFVWQQDRYAETAPPREVRAADMFQSVHAPGAHVLAVKASFWIPLR